MSRRSPNYERLRDSVAGLAPAPGRGCGGAVRPVLSDGGREGSSTGPHYSDGNSTRHARCVHPVLGFGLGDGGRACGQSATSTTTHMLSFGRATCADAPLETAVHKIHRRARRRRVRHRRSWVVRRAKGRRETSSTSSALDGTTGRGVVDAGNTSESSNARQLHRTSMPDK